MPICRDDLSASIKAHDFGYPLHLPIGSKRIGLLDAARSDRLPWLIRKPITGYMLAAAGGMDAGWERAARPVAASLVECFEPDVVWSVFGSFSALIVAQRLARRARVPWLMDIKDNWEIYTPALIRPLLRRRFADAAGFTSNAELHRDIAARWLCQEHRLVLYSGVADAMIAPPGASARDDIFLVTLIGSTYSNEKIAAFLSALGIWLSLLAPADRARVLLRYAGASEEAMRNALGAVSLPCRVEVTGNISHADLACLCRGAAANCYLWTPFGFHHKMLELLSTRRPLISFSGEHEESIRLAAKVGGNLAVCWSGHDLVAALDKVWGRWRAGDVSSRGATPSAVSWDAGAVKLEEFLLRAISPGSYHHAL